MEERLAGPDSSVSIAIRRRVANHLTDRHDVIVADTVATFPLTTESRRLDADYCVRLGTLVVRLLSEAILGGRLDSRGSGISDLTTMVAQRELSAEQFFTFVHIAMSTSIDELSLDEHVGVNTEPWPQVAQTVLGFERVYQGSGLLLSWPVRLGRGERWSRTIVNTVDATAADR